MARQTGARAKVALKRQALFSTLADNSPVYTQVPIYSTTMGGEAALEDVPLLSATASRDPGKAQLGIVQVAGDYVVPLDIIYLGHWLTMIFGSPTSAGTTDFTHTFRSTTPSPATQAFYSIEHQFPDAGVFPTFRSVMGNSMSVEWAVGGTAQATFSCVAAAETRPTVTGAGTLVAPSLTLFNQNHMTVKRSGATLANCVGATLNFTNNLDLVRSVSAGGLLDGADPGIAKCSGVLRMRYDDDTLITAALNQSTAPLELAFAISATQSITFTVNQSTFARPKTAIPGPNGIELEIAFEGYGTGTEMLTAVLKNQVAGTTYTDTL